MQGKERGFANPAKIYMQGYRQCAAQIRALLAERDRHLRDVGRYEAAFDRATKATSRMRAVSISGTPMHDGMANAVMDMLRYEAAARRGGGIDALTDKLNERIAHGAEMLAARLAMMDCLSDERYKTICTMRYISGWMWDRIATEMFCDRMTVWRLHGEALEEIRRMI